MQALWFDTILAVLIAFGCIYIGQLILKTNKHYVSTLSNAKRANNDVVNSDVIIFFGTLSGFSRNVAENIKNYASQMKTNFKISLCNIAHFEFDDYELISKHTTCVFVVPTYTDGVPPKGCQQFFDWLIDCQNDFRVNNRSFLFNVSFAIVGIGSKDYGNDFCTSAKNLRKGLLSLGAHEIKKIVLLNDQEELEEKIENFGRSIVFAKRKKNKSFDVESKNDETTSTELEEEDLINEAFLTVNEEKQPFEEEEKNVIGDLEDLVDKSNEAFLLGKSSKINRGMVTKAQRKSLTKEGYKIIGTHSAVKLCRWTKHQLRGRGGCYKHTFYNIASYQCMEMTPSLACANKCVFCWRHHKNPVGTSWRWKQDSPEEIVTQAITLHQQIVKSMNGVPGAKKERLAEAKNIRHCALSLVGEPIMYPRINELLKELHDREISTFLVTNGQFPEAIKTLAPTTQLYVSIDAGDEKSLKEIDRPLFKDFWKRYVDSLKALKEKGQRTVYRFTMVKKWNFDDINEKKEMDNYIQLVNIGEPDLIEIKAVTYCGNSPASDLTMENVPWHQEVRKFAETLCSKINSDSRFSFNYGTACEHVHSCCTLLARKDKFFKNKKWHTWINYDKYHELVQEYYDTEGKKTFSTEDYLAETPAWALWGAQEEGFDPQETRFRKLRNHKN